MRITAFNGSPRGKKSNTQFMVDAFLEGAAAEGAQTEGVLLAGKKIEQCLGCVSCWIKTPGVCVRKDAMAEMCEKFMASDVIIFATPLYVDNVSGIMKTFMDRLLPVMDPHFEIGEDGETRHPAGLRKYPAIVAMSNCGFPEQSQFQVLSLLFKRIARNMPSELICEIYRGQGALLAVQSDMLRPVVMQYRNLLVKAGAEVAREGKLSEATAAQLDKPLIPHEMYVAETNRYWDKMLAKLEKGSGAS